MSKSSGYHIDWKRKFLYFQVIISVNIVDTLDNNILAEFTSVVDAVNCAVEIQQDLAEQNAELPYNLQMQFRIGVHLGDVIEEEGRIYGAGVNMVARVES